MLQFVHRLRQAGAAVGMKAGTSAGLDRLCLTLHAAPHLGFGRRATHRHARGRAPDPRSNPDASVAVGGGVAVSPSVPSTPDLGLTLQREALKLDYVSAIVWRLACAVVLRRFVK
jgi:hypothetical protein